ncbi:MAG: FdtA/QdtA family cupin domain-containing protein [bacterium]
MNHKYQVYTLKNIQTPNFLMTALELKDYLDFPVKRIYFITSPGGEMKTGNHAHRKDEDEIFVMIQGSCTIQVDDGHGIEDIKLDGPKSAILVPHMVWHGFTDLSKDAIILAVTSTNYDPTRADYCESYEEFQTLCKKS